MKKERHKFLFHVGAVFIYFWAFLCFLQQTSCFGEISFKSEYLLQPHQMPSLHMSGFLCSEHCSMEYSPVTSEVGAFHVQQRLFSLPPKPTIKRVCPLHNDFTDVSGNYLSPSECSFSRQQSALSFHDAQLTQIPDDNVFIRRPGLWGLTFLGLILLIGLKIHISDEKRF